MKNEIKIHKKYGYAYINLRGRHGEYKGRVLFDLDDIEKIDNYRWSKNSHGYALSKINGISQSIHCFLMNTIWIDHINRNRLDNRKSNLRSITRCLNQHNSNLSIRNKSGCKGVCLSNINKYKKWQTTIQINGKRIFLGYFVNKKDAFRAIKLAEKKLLWINNEREGFTNEGKPILKKQVARRNGGVRTKNLSRKKSAVRSRKRASDTRSKGRKARATRI